MGSHFASPPRTSFSGSCAENWLLVSTLSVCCLNIVVYFECLKDIYAGKEFWANSVDFLPSHSFPSSVFFLIFLFGASPCSSCTLDTQIRSTVLFFLMSQIFYWFISCFEVVFADNLGLRFFAIILNHYTTATNRYPWLTLLISFTEAYPSPWFPVVINLNYVDSVLSTMGLQQLDVQRLITAGCKHAKMNMALI